MTHSEQLNELAAALSQYQATAKNPGNTARNPFLKNKYAPLNDILTMVRPELAKHGLSISQLVGGADTIGVTTMLMHKSGQYIADTVSLTPENSKGLSVAQNAGVVITYLRRYGIAAILGIAGEDDTDGAHGDDGPKQAPKPVNTKQQWRDAISKQAKAVGCDTPDKFYSAVQTKFAGHLAFVDGKVDWDKLDVKGFNMLIEYFKDDAWMATTAAAIFADDEIPFE
jgi:hypothetical protein